jgi:hypothetical protein
MPKKRKLPKLDRGVNLTSSFLKQTTPLMYMINMSYEPSEDTYSIEINFSQPVVRVVLPRSLLKEMANAGT